MRNRKINEIDACNQKYEKCDGRKQIRIHRIAAVSEAAVGRNIPAKMDFRHGLEKIGKPQLFTPYFSLIILWIRRVRKKNPVHFLVHGMDIGTGLQHNKVVRKNETSLILF
jgi:hypothetical protein